jgi:hypothetical protein
LGQKGEEGIVKNIVKMSNTAPFFSSIFSSFTFPFYQEENQKKATNKKNITNGPWSMIRSCLQKQIAPHVQLLFQKHDESRNHEIGVVLLQSSTKEKLFEARVEWVRMTFRQEMKREKKTSLWTSNEDGNNENVTKPVSSYRSSCSFGSKEETRFYDFQDPSLLPQFQKDLKHDYQTYRHQRISPETQECIELAFALRTLWKNGTNNETNEKKVKAELEAFPQLQQLISLQFFSLIPSSSSDSSDSFNHTKSKITLAETKDIILATEPKIRYKKHAFLQLDHFSLSFSNYDPVSNLVIFNALFTLRPSSCLV